jgi:hypothetical protein
LNREANERLEAADLEIYVKFAQRVEPDFEELGYSTMIQTGDQSSAQDICGLKIRAHEDKLRPEMADVTTAIQQLKAQSQALCSHLYDRHVPVSAARILGKTIEADGLAIMISLAALASIGGHVTTFYLTGTGSVVAVVLGVGITGLAAIAGYQAHEKFLLHHRVLEGILILAAFGLCFWGLFQMAQARGGIMDRLTRSSSSQAFVDDGAEDANTIEPEQPSDQSLEQKVRNFMGSAMAKIMLAADLVLGILLSAFIRLRTDEDFAAWRHLKKASQRLRFLEMRYNELVYSVEMAKKHCMAGILRARHAQRKRVVPYHQILPLLLLLVLLFVSPAFSQSVAHHEGILLDVSGSIGKGGINNDLFREYLLGVKKLLLTEPPDSRVWVSVITTESFGSVRSLVKGWTPDAQGVFTDNLNRARHQLAASFEAKSAELSPAAAGTDIFGGLWQQKAILESGATQSTSSAATKSIWIVSDMMNESANFQMPALLPSGPDRMLAIARSNGLIVPLHGYKVHVIGASPAGLSPQTWNSLKTFWTLYFREAGAELVSYSAECNVDRE